MSSNYALTVGGSTAPGSGSAVTIKGPLSGFGEVSVEQPTPVAQVDFVYSNNPFITTTRTYSTGTSVTTVDGEVLVQSGTVAGSYSRVYISRAVNYRPGQGSLIRMTARFSAGVVGNTQSIGAYNAEGGYRFGYVDTVFGIIHTTTGTREVQALTVTAAPAAPGNVTVTLDGGPAVVVPVTASGSTSICASQIAAGNYLQAAGGWRSMSIANVVYFVRNISGPAGASTFAPGATGTVAAFTTPTPGVTQTDIFIPQTTWNIDQLDGTWSLLNPSGMLIDTSKGNVYQIQFQYLGFGDAFFSIENPATGLFAPVHVIRNANSRTSTSLRNPNVYVTWESYNTTATTQVTLRGASGLAAIEGTQRFLGPLFAYLASRAVNASTETPVLSLRSTLYYQGRANTRQIQVDRITVACEGTKPVEFRIYLNANLTSPVWARNNATASIADIDVSATVASGGTLVYAFTVSKTGDIQVDLQNLGVYLQAGNTFTITATSVNATDAQVTAVWIED